MQAKWLHFLNGCQKNHTYHPTVPVCLWESRGDHEDNSNNCNASCNPTWQLETYFIFKTADICLDQFSLVTCHTSLNKAFCWCPSKNFEHHTLRQSGTSSKGSPRAPLGTCLNTFLLIPVLSFHASLPCSH